MMQPTASGNLEAGNVDSTEVVAVFLICQFVMKNLTSCEKETIPTVLPSRRRICKEPELTEDGSLTPNQFSDPDPALASGHRWGIC